MRKFIAVFFALTLVAGGISKTAYAGDCAKDTLIDQFGDWFGNLNKPESVKKQKIAIRKANRLADCAEKQSLGKPRAL